jgi:hypothetical protein
MQSKKAKSKLPKQKRRGKVLNNIQELSIMNDMVKMHYENI